MYVPFRFSNQKNTGHNCNLPTEIRNIPTGRFITAEQVYGEPDSDSKLYHLRDFLTDQFSCTIERVDDAPIDVKLILKLIRHRSENHGCLDPGVKVPNTGTGQATQIELPPDCLGRVEGLLLPTSARTEGLA